MSATGSANDRNEFLRSLRNGAIIGAVIHKALLGDED